jgi:hypothetical protein
VYQRHATSDKLLQCTSDKNQRQDQRQAILQCTSDRHQRQTPATGPATGAFTVYQRQAFTVYQRQPATDQRQTPATEPATDHQQRSRPGSICYVRNGTTRNPS